MKNLIIKIISVIAIMIPFKSEALTTMDAKEAIVSKNGTLSLEYKYDDYKINDINVKIYRVASVSSDFRYTLIGDFKDLPVKINGIKTVTELNNLEEVFESYIVANKPGETSSGIVLDNKVSFNDLQTGMYFVITEKIDTKDYSLLFKSFLISVPTLNEEGTWNYDVSACPKPLMFTPKYEDITYTIIKEWRDNNINRPKEIEIDIYKNGEIAESVILSRENNWQYSFTTKDDGSIWNVLEKNVLDDYTVSINKTETKFIVINTKEEEPPKTVDNIYLYFIILIGSIIGMSSTLIIFRKAKED